MTTILRDFLLTYAWNALWQVPLFCAVGWLAAWLVRGTGLVLRQRVAVITLLLAVIVPGLPGRFAPASSLLRMWPWSASDGGNGAIITSLSNPRTASPNGLHALPGNVLNLSLAVYLTLLAIAAVRFGHGLWRLRRLVQGSHPVPLDASRKEAFEHLLRMFRLRGVSLRESDDVGGPTAFWMGVPTLLLPSRFVQEATFYDLMAALAHECAHLQRRDFALQLIYTACTLPIAMHPLTAILKDRIAESREMLCDALAAHSLSGGESYASALLRIAALLPKLRPTTHLHAIGMLDAHSFERRIINMVNPQVSRSRMGRFGSVLAAGVLGVVACTSALALHTTVKGEMAHVQADQAVITKPEIVYRRDPVYPAEARAEKNTLNGSVTLAVEVNAVGKPTSVRVTRSLRADYDESAVDAVTEWRFDPGRENGKPVPATLSININYLLQP